MEKGRLSGVCGLWGATKMGRMASRPLAAVLGTHSFRHRVESEDERLETNTSPRLGMFDAIELDQRKVFESCEKKTVQVAEKCYLGLQTNFEQRCFRRDKIVWIPDLDIQQKWLG